MSQNFKDKITEKAIGEFEEQYGRKPDESEITEFLWSRGYQNLIRQNDFIWKLATNQPVKFL